MCFPFQWSGQHRPWHFRHELEIGESLLFKLFITPSVLSVAQRHCTILVVIIAIRNLPFHSENVHIIPIVISIIFSNTSGWRGLSLFVTSKVELYTVEVREWQADDMTEILSCQWRLLQKWLYKNSNKDDLFWNYQDIVTDYFIPAQN